MIDRNTQLTDHFTLGEFLHSGVEPKDIPTLVLENLIILAKRLEEARTKLGKPMIITSGYRTLAHNKKVGGVMPDPKRPGSGSYHLYGKAADFVVPGMKARDVQKKLEWWNGGMEYAPTWTHLDLGPKRRFTP